jgi:hypothetical protein
MQERRFPLLNQGEGDFYSCSFEVYFFVEPGKVEFLFILFFIHKV